jgi:CIC family chloride channel protein
MWTQLAKRSPSENAFLLLIPLVGISVGAAALGIAHLIGFVQEQLWGSGEDLLGAAMRVPWTLRVFIPAGGGLVLGLLGWILRVRMRGHGIAGVIQALALKGGVISLRKEYPRTAAGVLTVATGGSLGREGPMVEFGAALSSWLGRRFRLETPHLRILVCSAAGAGLAAAYNAPIGGTIFAMEILIGNFAMEVFGPAVIAAVLSTLVFRSAMGDLTRFVIPTYELVSPWELTFYLGLGLLAGVFSAGAIRAMGAFEGGFHRLPIPSPLKPAVGFALVGAIGCWLPNVYGNGYETVNLALREELPLRLLLILPVAKLVATAVTRGSGGTGGIFTPTLMMGSLLGGAFGTFIHNWFPASTAGPGAYALVGMGAVVAGTTHAPIMAIMMIFEQTNSYQIILPLMFVCIISNWTVRLLKRESLHIDSLRRRGVVLPRGPEGSVMQSLKVANLMHDDPVAVRQTDSFATVVEHFVKLRHNYLYVVDDESRFVGAIPLHELKAVLNQQDQLQVVIAHDLVNPEFAFVTPDDALADTMETFWRQNSERLPVVNNAADRKLVGWISKRDLIGVYNQEILRKRQLMGRFGVEDDEEGERESYVELPPGLSLRQVAVPPAYAGKTLRETDPRHAFGLHVLQIERWDPRTGAGSVEMPGPDTVLRADDRLTVVGRPEAIARFREGASGDRSGPP